MEHMTIVPHDPPRRLPRGQNFRAALAAATVLASVPLLAPPAFAQLGTQSGANSNPNGGQTGDALQAAGRAAAGETAPPAATQPGVTGPGATGPGAAVRPPAGTPNPVPVGAPAPAVGAAPQNAISVLLQQATFWHGQTQNGRAMEALGRALELDPNNAEALALTAQIQIEQGNAGQANAALQKLRASSPNDPHIAQIDRALRIGQINPTQLAEARRLSQEGRNAEAVQRYQQIFRGNPPPDTLAVEYYQTLSGTEGGWERARDGLAQIIRDNPADLRAQLAYAQLLTYREGARTEGIARLAALAANPAVADQATKAWRQALGWLPVATSSVQPLSDYLARHPNDTSVQKMVEAARNPPQGAPDAIGESRVAGYKALNAGELAAAAKGFEAAIAADPNDADALGGLGIVRLRQGRTAEARSLLTRAIAADPSKRAQWQAALNGTDVPQEITSIRVAANRGDYAGAERQIRALMGRGNNPGLQLMLADVQARSGDLAAAETSYRAVLAASPRSAPAMVGLAGVLQQTGRTAEAEDLLTRAGATGSLKAIAQARAQQLREQAALVTDPATKVGMYRAAMAADPSNPWIRLDLARALVKQGQPQEAQNLMNELVAPRQLSTDALQAAIIFASENNLPSATAELIGRVPPGRRTPQMQATLAQAQLNRDIQATMTYPPEVARSRLLAMAAAAPDPDGTRGAAIARALFRLGDPNSARAAIASAQTVTRGGTAEQRVNYAGALMDIGDAASAQHLLGTLNPAELSPQDRTAATSMHEGLVVRTSDQLNQAGRRADAYDRLAPVLRQDPTSPSVNLALARLYSSADDPQQALAINLSVLRRDPGNLDARNAAVTAAIAAGDRATADRLVSEGLQLNPNDPRVWIISADLARARGNNVRAIRDLERARQLRQQQIGGSDAGADYGTGAPSATPPAPAAAAPTGATVTLSPDGPPIHADASPAPAPAAAPPAQASAVPPAAAGSVSVPQGGVSQAGQAPLYRPVQYVSPMGGPTPLMPPLYAAPPDPTPLPLYPPVRRATPAASPVYPAGEPPAFAPQAVAPSSGAVPSGAPFSYTPAPPTYVSGSPSVTPGLPQAGPVQTGPDAAGSPFIYSNPFRSTTSNSTFGSTTVPVATEDPMTAQINQSIAALRSQIAPSLQGDVLLRGRSGTGGLDSLTEAAVPMEATFSPGGYGQLRILAQPTYLSAGTLSSNAFSQARLGTQALSIVPTGGTATPPFTGTVFGAQHAEGVGLDAGYKFNWVSADIGTTPLGFAYNNLIGGVEVAPRLSENVLLRVTAERRAVTDSLLAYAGQKDPRTGAEFGGVTRTRGYAQLELSAGLANFYVGGGYAGLKGNSVEQNYEGEAGAGGSYPVYRTATDELRVGLDLVYFGFQKNLANFSLGQGGYFSPQNYFAALIPVNWQSKAIENLTYTVGGALGYQVFNESSSPYYPGNPGLQNQLDSLALGVPGLQTSYGSKSVNGVTGIIHAAAEYQLNPSFKVGATASYQHAGDYNEGQGLLYAKYLFNGGE